MFASPQGGCCRQSPSPCLWHLARWSLVSCGLRCGIISRRLSQHTDRAGWLPPLLPEQQPMASTIGNSNLHVDRRLPEPSVRKPGKELAGTLSPTGRRGSPRPASQTAVLCAQWGIGSGQGPGDRPYYRHSSLDARTPGHPHTLQRPKGLIRHGRAARQPS